MQRAFASENAKRQTNIYTLLLNSLIVTRSRQRAPSGSLTADDVGRAILERFEDRPENGATITIPS